MPIINLDDAKFQKELGQTLWDLRDFIAEETVAGRPVIVVIEKPTLWERIKRMFGRG